LFEFITVISHFVIASLSKSIIIIIQKRILHTKIQKIILRKLQAKSTSTKNLVKTRSHVGKCSGNEVRHITLVSLK